jgi:hypothetical protein
MNSERKTYTLKDPIELSGIETIRELHVRKPKAKDLRSMPADGRTVGHQLDLIGKLTGQPQHVVDELSLEDLEGVSSIVDGFHKSGPPIGITPSP